MLLGRTRELEAIDRLVGDVRAGRGRGLLVTGEAGIGKTALLDVAAGRAAGFRVIATVGIEAEADLPFAALGEVATPLLAHLEELPEPQADAIRAALALAEHPATGSRLAACAGLLGLLRCAAREQPLLVLIDDAQWLDASSRECLGYAARRLERMRVGMLAAARTERDRGAPARIDPDSRALDGWFPDELRLGGLQRDDAAELLQASAGELAPATADAVLAAAAGNPLALIELPALLSEHQRRGLAPFAPAAIPGGDLWAAFARRVEALEPAGREAVLVTSASLDRALAPVVGACRELGLAVSALEHAEQAGILILRDDHGAGDDAGREQAGQLPAEH